MITKETINLIFDSAKIEEVVGEFVNLKKRGANFTGLCPFHDEKTPSFSVSASKGIYKCFGCGKGGNAVNFLMEHENYSYPEALKYLAKKYNIEVEETEPDPEEQQSIDEKEALFNITAFAQKYFNEVLLDSEEGKAIGLSYFKERGYTVDILKKFGLGYCLNKWDDFSRHAMKNGYDKELLIESSLSKSKDGSTYDTFRGRVIFPIHNLSGRVLGFGARIIKSEKNKPKYLNTAESNIYQKSKALYGLYFAKSAIVKEDNCFLVEGYTDVISLHQAGIENVISSSGTSLTIEQIRLIRRYTNNITLLFDSDAAGVKAAFRSIDMVLEEGLNVKIILFPEEEDPDSYAQKHRPAETKNFLQKNAVDFITFKARLLYDETKDDPIKKASLIKEIANTISLIPDPIIRTLYVQKCAGLVSIEEKILFMEINKLRRKKSKDKAITEIKEEQESELEEILSEKQLKPVESSDYQEKELLRALIQYGNEEISFVVKDENDKDVEKIVKVMDFLIDEILIDEIEFENKSCQSVFEEIVDLREKNAFDFEQHFLHHTNEEKKKFAIDITTTPYTVSDNWEKVHSIFILREKDNIKQNVERILYSFKLKKLEKILADNQETLKNTSDIEETMNCVAKDNKLKKIRTLIAKKLSRVVTK